MLGIGVVLTLLATGRRAHGTLLAALVLMWAGLFFSYSQSSMTALLLVTLAIAFATGDRPVRRAWACWRWAPPSSRSGSARSR